MARPRQELKPRLTVVDSVYHVAPGAPPVQAVSRFARWLESDEQPYVRRLAIGPEWQALERGWVERASMMVLAHDQKVGGMIDLGADSSAGVVPCAVLGPGESLRLQPHDLAGLRVRCPDGPCRATLTLFPG